MLSAFRAFLLEPRGVFALGGSGDDAEATERIHRITRVITDSPALLARERQVIDGYTETLAAAIAAETGEPADAVRPRAVAAALLGVHRALIGYVRHHTLAGAGAAQIAEGIRIEAERALDQLEQGLGHYLPRQP